MTILVADVGGTNTRFAMFGPDRAARAWARFQNDDHPSFTDVLATYVAQQNMPEISGFCVAIAGPVTSDSAKLTNRDWTFDKGAIAEIVPGLVPAAVRLINDLVALGLALPALSDDQLAGIKASVQAGAANDQALVVGLGTGVNACLVKGNKDRCVVVEAELGHASLPSNIANALNAAIGDASGNFPSVEELFSGRGLARLYSVMSDGQKRQGRDILADYDAGTGGAVAETVDLLAGLLGLFARQLVYMYQPFGGVHFAGGVARGILGSTAISGFLETFEQPGRFADQIGKVPVRLITDDAAALTGAAEFIERSR